MTDNDTEPTYPSNVERTDGEMHVETAFGTATFETGDHNADDALTLEREWDDIDEAHRMEILFSEVGAVVARHRRRRGGI